MFIREKIIYNQPYAYLVRTRWDKKSKKVKQKVSKYLGKIHRLERIRNTKFLEYYNNVEDISNYVDQRDLKYIIIDLIELELYRHGFEKREKGIVGNGEKEIHFKTVNDIKGVFAMNEGFLTNETIKQILRFDKIYDEDERKYPFKFAELFVNAGLDIDKDLFINLYQKCFSDSISGE